MPKKKHILMASGFLAALLFLVTGYGIISAGDENLLVEEGASVPVQHMFEVKTETQQQEVGFMEIKRDDANLERGKTEVRQAGTKGTKVITYEVIYFMGTELGRSVVAEDVTVQPGFQIVAVGTAEPAPAPVYAQQSPQQQTNSQSTTAAAPAPPPAPPPPVLNPRGPTVYCRDGTTDYYGSSNPCAGHGGMCRSWFMGRCEV